MEEKKAKRIFVGSSSTRDKDKFSRLPDPLISKILLHLPTKEAVSTSVLSNSWRSLWMLSPELGLDSNKFDNYNAFASFVDRYLDFSREEKLRVHKLKLSIHKNENDQSCITRWIDFLASRELKHLEVECFGKRTCMEVLPVSLFICETLVYLKLRQVLFGCSFEDSSSISLPCLRTMHLEVNEYANEKSLESLISSCPVLEDLKIERRFDDNVKILRVRSKTLTSLSVKYTDYCGEVVYIIVRDYGVLIDAPKLKYLDFVDEDSHSKTIINSGSLTEVNIHGRFDINDDTDELVFTFFTSISGVRVLNISPASFSFIKDLWVPLPDFCNLSRLEVKIGFDELEDLQRFLARCLNLRSLVLCLWGSCVTLRMRPSIVPLCLMSSVKFIEIQLEESVYNEDFNGDFIVEIVRYFVENSVILEKFVLPVELAEYPNVVSGLLPLERLLNQRLGH